MRVLLLSVIIFFGSNQALGSLRLPVFLWAPEQPQLSQPCRQAQGRFSILKGGEGEIPVCVLGEAVVSAKTLFLFKSKSQEAESIKAYKSRKMSAPRGGVCGAFDSELVQGQDASGVIYNLCRFEDNSFIEQTTLWMGPGSSVSRSFDEAFKNQHEATGRL